MAEAGWTSATLLTRFNQAAGRPQSPGGTDAITDATKYQYLADAEQEILGELAAIDARVLFGAPTAMSTADGGATWTFGTDGNGYTLFPLGPARIYQSLQSVPQAPWTPGVDYLDEGTRIRVPNGQTYAGPLYWYGLTIPAQMSASVEPLLRPETARTMIVSKAVETFANNYARNPDLADRMSARYAGQKGTWFTVIRRHFAGGGAMGPLLVPWGVGSYGPGWAGAWW